MRNTNKNVESRQQTNDPFDNSVESASRAGTRPPLNVVLGKQIAPGMTVNVRKGARFISSNPACASGVFEENRFMTCVAVTEILAIGRSEVSDLGLDLSQLDTVTPPCGPGQVKYVISPATVRLMDAMGFQMEVSANDVRAGGIVILLESDNR
jgi:hypothetical protein